MKQLQKTHFFSFFKIEEAKNQRKERKKKAGVFKNKTRNNYRKIPIIWEDFFVCLFFCFFLFLIFFFFFRIILKILLFQFSYLFSLILTLSNVPELSGTEPWMTSACWLGITTVIKSKNAINSCIAGVRNHAMISSSSSTLRLGKMIPTIEKKNWRDSYLFTCRQSSDNGRFVESTDGPKYQYHLLLSQFLSIPALFSTCTWIKNINFSEFWQTNYSSMLLYLFFSFPFFFWRADMWFHHISFIYFNLC